ncbi:adenine nucleotide alpha hydrolases-like protein [Fistulina hepatica ATCC 64428]|nr:adenine nucleotide alpha hydrolases-like protein [Fistulina hepatica ATCC 64428]
MSSSAALLPISTAEFTQLINSCSLWKRLSTLRPSNRRIAVANSGGPDSTCLLFLLRRHFAQNATLWPVSLHVDHGVQSASALMASRCERVARDMLGVEHLTMRILWGTPPFPDLPGPAHLETICRKARYRYLFDGLKHVNARVLAFAHHADDQVETALMRVASGSTALGAAGMRCHRRWGMGDENSLSWAGHEGMSRFIVRPLLNVSKDRILATCDSAQLEYVVDETNFQPSLTIRNAIRWKLDQDSRSSTSITGLPPGISARLDDVVSSAAQFDVPLDMSKGRAHLREKISELNGHVSGMDAQAKRHLLECLLPSPHGTLALSVQKLANVSDDDLLHSMIILKLLRYVSPRPWGSVAAEAGRSRTSIDLIKQNLFCRRSVEDLRPFTAGSDVLWRPVTYRVGNKQTCWLLSRQPPARSTVGHEPLVVDLSDRLLTAVSADTELVEVLWDNRFLVRLVVNHIPPPVIDELWHKRMRMRIVPSNRLYAPQVLVERRQGQADNWEPVHTHNALENDALVSEETHVEIPRMSQSECARHRWAALPASVVRQTWATIRWARALGH